MLALADNRGDTTLAFAGSDPGTSPTGNFHLALTGVGRILILGYGIWEGLSVSLFL